MGENWDKEHQTPSIRQLPNSPVMISAMPGRAEFSPMKVGILKILKVAVAVLEIECYLLSNICLTFLEALNKPGLPHLFLLTSVVCFH